MAFGQIRFVIDELDLDSQASSLNMDIAVHIAGWKSIMGDPDKPKIGNKKRTAGSMKSTTTTTTVKKS
jgi:hypothetical protein